LDQSTVITSFFILPLLGYLLGSIPFGLLIGRAHGIDIRQHGSGNIGTTNVGRLLGRKWGYICFVLDVGKGLVPMIFARRFLADMSAEQLTPMAGMSAWMLVGTGCILGHMFSVYLRFGGGKGVATSLGVMLGVWPYFTFTAVVVLLIWIAVLGLWRYVSLASICAAFGFPVIFAILIKQLESWEFANLWPLFAFGCLMGTMVIVRHRSNIVRLLAGTENQIGKKNQS